MRPLSLLVAIAAISCCLGLGGARAQGVRPEAHAPGVLLVVRDASGLVTNDSPLYLASNRVGWNPGDPTMRLSGRSDLRWQILLPGPVGDPPLAFKFTRGSWETVEVAPDLSDIPNRTLEPVPAAGIDPSKPLVVELEIARFADERAAGAGAGADERPANITGEVRLVQVIGGASIASGLMRDVIVWLPPGYDHPANADRRYPVLYLQDGQNVFDYSPPTPGEWGADETATALIDASEIEPIIIVGIPHSRRGRFSEYMPSPVRGGAGARVDAQGDAYVHWLVREVVPRVERAFRADPDARGIGGSSLGALVALRAAQLYPDEFERILAESPSLLLRGADLTEDMARDLEPSSRRFFIGMGGRETGDDPARNTELVGAARALAEKLSGAGVVHLEIDPGAGHNEQAWADRLPEALRFLYPTD